jgi:hypothetical protein
MLITTATFVHACITMGEVCNHCYLWDQCWKRVFLWSWWKVRIKEMIRTGKETFFFLIIFLLDFFPNFCFYTVVCENFKTGKL